MINNYISRIVEKEIQETMKAVGCVVIEGPKACGKSTTAEMFAKTTIELQHPKEFERQRLLISSEENIFDKDKPILFDEWQKIPELWDMIRTEVDHTNAKGEYILTGSAQPLEDNLRHSGVGRFGTIRMYPMSLFESGESNGNVLIRSQCQGQLVI